MIKQIKKTKNKDNHDFIRKTHQILQNEQNNQYIAWSESGDEIIIVNRNGFEQHVLPQYFRHDKCTSFIRSLNLYGFKNQINQFGQKVFKHPHFNRDGLNIVLFQRRQSLPLIMKEEMVLDCQRTSQQLADIQQQQQLLIAQINKEVTTMNSFSASIMNLHKEITQYKLRSFREGIRLLRQTLQIQNGCNTLWMRYLIMSVLCSQFQQAENDLHLEHIEKIGYDSVLPSPIFSDYFSLFHQNLEYD